jgi:ectoine hydroxylase-related dioxygenase (phytanoyl-CoA dioxygenase family)
MIHNRTITGPLMSNGFVLERTPERLGWMVPTDAALPLAHIKDRYHQQGYVWLKGFFERREILAFRRDFFAAFEGTGLLAQGSDPVEGLYGDEGEQRALIKKIFWEMVRSPAYEVFCTMPRLWKFYEALLQDEPYLHTRKIIRYTLPGERNCTGGHYDLIYLRAGTDRLYSSWIPLGDIPVEMGGLIYLEGSDALGREMEAEFSARNADLPPEERISAYNKNMREGGWVSIDLADMARRFNSRWLVADYEAGDMVIHSPYMVHAATVNNDPHGRLRLSTDIRYQTRSDTIDTRWTKHLNLPRFCGTGKLGYTLPEGGQR